MTLLTGECEAPVSPAAPTAASPLQPTSALIFLFIYFFFLWGGATKTTKERERERVGAPPATASVPVSRGRILSHFDARAGTALPRARAEDVRMDVERLHCTPPPPPPNDK